MIIHVDCNSFFASCEKIFRPALWHSPVVVTSNSENGGGIIVALSPEAKKVGLKRGDAVFKVKEIVEKNKVAVFPSNFSLYGDISRRIRMLVKQTGLVRNYQQYSIDEFFAEIIGDAATTARAISERITHATDIPVSCGCASTYTLAKVATYFAKHYPYPGHFCIITEAQREKALSLLPVGDIWGIGRRNNVKLTERGIKTALDFVHLNAIWVKSRMSITGLSTWKELQGTPCINIDELPEKKSICTSRSFDTMISDKATLQEAVANFTSCCAKKLRSQQSVCSTITLFLLTNMNRQDLPQYFNEETLKLTVPSSATGELIKNTFLLLDKLFKEGFLYKKAGVILSDIASEEVIQMDLFDSTDRKQQQKLMKTIDGINHRYGADKVRVTAQGMAHNAWKISGLNGMRCFSTNLQDVITVN